MATDNNITLAHLTLALERVKSYSENTYSQIGHTHGTNEVPILTGYTIASGGTESGETMRIGLSHTDSLNEALGKLDKSILNIVTNIGSINVKDHNHDDIYYTMLQIDKFIEDLEKADTENLGEAQTYADEKVREAIDALVDGAPDALNTLKEIADSLGDDTNIAGTIVNGLAEKVTGPSDSVDNHVMVFDGITGKLAKDSGFTIGCSVPGDAIFTDHNVRTEPMASSALFLAGTTSSSAIDGTLGINSSFYIDGDQGKLVAPIVFGNLEGVADEATLAATAVKTQAAISIKFNGEAAGTFNGETAVELNITPGAIGAHDQDYTLKATDNEVEDLLNDIFGTI